MSEIRYVSMQPVTCATCHQAVPADAPYSTFQIPLDKHGIRASLEIAICTRCVPLPLPNVYEAPADG